MLTTKSNQLTREEQLDLITNFRLLIKTKQSEEVVPLTSLLDESFLLNYINNKKLTFHTNNLFVVASQLLKRIGFLFTVPALYSLSTFDKLLPVEITNSYIVPAYKNDKWLPNLYLKDMTIKTITPNSRKNEREQYILKLFASIAKVIQATSKVSSVPKPILWENIAIYVYWLYESKLANNDTAKDDFNYMITELEPSVFQESYNPLKRFYSEKREVTEQDDLVRIRRTCCFYFETTDEGDFCKTCPKAKGSKEACRVTKSNFVR